MPGIALGPGTITGSSRALTGWTTPSVSEIIFPLSVNQSDGFIPGYQHFCALWDDSCSGSKSEAYMNFDRLVTWSGFNSCARDLSVCTLKDLEVPKVSISAAANLLSFAHSPKCISDFSYQVERDTIPCCTNCTFSPTVADVYYWPDPDLNDSCLDIIGHTVHPLDYGASTASALSNNMEGSIMTVMATYWGCRAPVSFSLDLGGTYQTTALLATIGNLTFKTQVVNPWSPAIPCLDTDLHPSPSHGPIITSSSTQIRLHSIVKPILSSQNLNNQSVVSVITHSGYTL